MRGICAVLIVSMSLTTAVFAVTWQMDGAAFQFSSAAVKHGVVAGRGDFLRCTPGANAVVFHYSLPRAAALENHTLDGRLVAAFDLAPGVRTISWNIAGRQTPAGIYMAVLRHAAAGQTIRISIVK